jgi:arsenite-transporting ATPase
LSRQIPEFVENRDLRLLLFGGKGGVGKTTMAAATALYLARTRGEDKRILVISTDPAHSLSDSFDVRIGDRVTAIRRSEDKGRRSDVDGQAEVDAEQSTYDYRMTMNDGRRPNDSEANDGRRPNDSEANDGRRPNDSEANDVSIQCPLTNLFAWEPNANRLLDEFKEKNHDIIKKLAERGTYFDEEDIAGFLELSLPGLDEIMAIMEIAALLKEENYDIVILDTAPTGHTVRMLNLPEQMLKWLKTMDLLQHKHRYMTEVFSGRKYRKDAYDSFLDDLSSDIARVRKLLSDEKITRFVPVMIPEPMSIYETERLVGSLEKNGVPVKEIVINNVAESQGCALCRSRKDAQRESLEDIEERFSAYGRIRVPLFPHEVRGLNDLDTVGDCFTGKGAPSTGKGAPAYPVKSVDGTGCAGSCLDFGQGIEFIIFGGKGGVGKTTFAAATALRVARRDPAKKVLLFSTDPAHSLSDSLDQPIGDEITPVRDARITAQGQTGLFALEIDADAMWAEFKKTFKRDIEALFDRFVTRGADIRFDREAMTELVEFAPPGIDEIMSLSRIMDLRNEGAFDVFILDTSPTGHLLRFLELPDLSRKWLNAFFGLLLKYKGVVRLTKAAEKALALSRNVRRIQETLTDPERTEFVATTVPEAMAVSELERLMLALQDGNIPCRHIVLNKAVPEMDCGFCAIKRAEQQEYVRKISSMFPDRTIVQAPLFPRQLRGIEDLTGLGDALFCNANRLKNAGK